MRRTKPPTWCDHCGCNVERSCGCSKDCQKHPKGKPAYNAVVEQLDKAFGKRSGRER